MTTALLQDSFDLESLLQETQVPGLRVLAAGPVPPNPTQLLSSSRMSDLLAALQAETDILVVDSPPATAFADAALLSTQVSGVLLVIDAGKTRRDSARKAIDALKHVNAPILGVLLNRMPRSSADFYYYYHYYEEREGRSSRRSDAKSPSCGGQERAEVASQSLAHDRAHRAVDRSVRSISTTVPRRPSVSASAARPMQRSAWGGRLHSNPRYPMS